MGCRSTNAEAADHGVDDLVDLGRDARGRVPFVPREVGGEALLRERGGSAEAQEQAGALLLDWCLGTIPVGAAIGAVLGVCAWTLAHWRDRRRAAAAPAAD